MLIGANWKVKGDHHTIKTDEPDVLLMINAFSTPRRYSSSLDESRSIKSSTQNSVLDWHDWQSM
ncbi:MAG: hypothetical protein JRH20_29715 [Deltaproteobacteria bacterium]|nr:hypothetical protein [Deltaproteobacteria bacterium]